jgi:hypothetical protein
MTYYKYAERDATSQVNWADVSKKWTDQINQVSTDRDKKAYRFYHQRPDGRERRRQRLVFQFR